MKPFFCYFGGKYRAAPHYPKPLHSTIIEPFAGAAGYSMRHHTANVLLCDLDPVIVGIWRYLIRTPPEEIRRIPLIESEGTIDDLGNVPEEVRWLVGFWLNKGVSRPCKRPSKWMREKIRPHSFWSEIIRERIASQVGKIRHWAVVEGSYDQIPDVEATWFIDPPYQSAGKDYKHGSKGIDFDALGGWCKSRSGQVIVCENEGADWLPFEPFRDIKATEGRRRKARSMEVAYVQ